MKEDQEQHQELRSETITRNASRNLAHRQIAQENTFPLAGNFESNLLQFNDNSSSDPVPSSSSVSNVPFIASGDQHTQSQSKIINVPTDLIGSIYGPRGSTIANFQLLSGANIEIEDLKEAPYSRERETGVRLKGTSEQINRAEKLINDLIEEVDGVKVPPGADELVIQFPNERVRFLLGIDLKRKRKIQESSGARIQVIPLKLPPGDASTERDILIKGDAEQIVSAIKLINEEKYKKPPGGNNYIQPADQRSSYWHPPGLSQVHQQRPRYGDTQPGGYPELPPPSVAGWAWQNQPSISGNPTLSFNQRLPHSRYGYYSSTRYFIPDQPAPLSQESYDHPHAPNLSMANPGISNFSGTRRIHTLSTFPRLVQALTNHQLRHIFNEADPSPRDG